ncbi:MAG TPA: hypothetical protein VFQ22_09585 [Longimicrobiales bacterium]|nr:hypothetical protein [Longimicrobiales bacterium]
MSLREVADTLGITHVYLGEVERGRRRVLPEKHWEKLVQAIPGLSLAELELAAAASEPLDPAAMEEGPGREVVVALARALEAKTLSEDVAKELLEVLQRRRPLA